MRIAILGSGKGSTADALLRWEREQGAAFRTTRLICTSPRSGLIDVAARYDVPASVVPYGDGVSFAETVIEELERDNSQFLVLAGFVKRLPLSVIDAMNGRVINTHPALLPRHGGPGMYGIHVHQAVLDAGDAVSGVSVHWVTEEYDAGAVISQQAVRVLPDDSAERLQQRVKQVEGGFLAATLDRLCRSKDPEKLMG